MAGRGRDWRRQAGARDRRPPRGHPRAPARTACKRLRTDVIDLYYLHRWDKQVPIEDSVGAMARPGARGQDAQPSACRKCRPPRCAAPMPCTPSRPCRPSIRCGRATPRSPCSRPAANSARPSSPSARWRAASCAGTLRDVAALRRQGHPPQHAALRARQLRRQPEAAAGLQAHRARGGLHAGAAGAGLAAAQGRRTSSRSPAPPAWRTCRTTWAPLNVQLDAGVDGARWKR